MEYPKTIGQALDALQGDWQKEGTEMSFSIDGMEVTDPNGVFDIHGNEVTHNMNFTMKKSNSALDKWTLNCYHLFGMSADITYWDENSFTTSEFPVENYNPNERQQRRGVQPLVQKFQRLHKPHVSQENLRQSS